MLRLWLKQYIMCSFLSSINVKFPLITPGCFFFSFSKWWWGTKCIREGLSQLGGLIDFAESGVGVSAFLLVRGFLVCFAGALQQGMHLSSPLASVLFWSCSLKGIIYHLYCWRKENVLLDDCKDIFYFSKFVQYTLPTLRLM